MQHWFVSRHRGAQEWALSQGIKATVVRHFDTHLVHAGDVVIGNLPVHLAAEVCARGARYLHLALDVPEHLRGRELTAEEIQRYALGLVEYRVEAVL